MELANGNKAIAAMLCRHILGTEGGQTKIPNLWLVEIYILDNMFGDIPKAHGTYVDRVKMSEKGEGGCVPKEICAMARLLCAQPLTSGLCWSN